MVRVQTIYNTVQLTTDDERDTTWYLLSFEFLEPVDLLDSTDITLYKLLERNKKLT